MVITSVTIGYGDIYPRTPLARAIIVLVILSVFAVFGENISKIGSLIRDTNFNNRYYKFKNHLVLIGSLDNRDLYRFILTVLEKEGIENFPRIIIVGEKRIKDTQLEMITKNEILERSIFYLSVEEGIDYVAFKKAALHNCKAVYFFGKTQIDTDSETHT